MTRGHRRNRFRAGYDFPRLLAGSPDVRDFVRTVHGHASIDFADPEAVTTLNRALLRDAYGLQWSLPRGALCPPIPGRSDYLHHLADLLSDGDAASIPRGPAVRILDIGTGASCIYPLIGASEYGWRFVGSEIDKPALHWARQIVRVNRSVAALIECRLQPDRLAAFAGVVKVGETFDASMCNPPFHASASDAAEGTRRKRRGLGLANTAAPSNFGGTAAELWCPGGEVGFIERMILESAGRPRLCRWFTTLVSRSEHLPRLRRSLRGAGAPVVNVIEMAQGNKTSRMLAWTYQADESRRRAR